MHTNLILATDSYKLGHWQQYPEGTQTVYSYMESRPGARWSEIQWFGLQYILERYLCERVTQEDVDEADKLARVHFGHDGLFNRAGWQHIVDKHDGKLPLRIKSVPEGYVLPVHNVLMTVENTCDECFWLTNAMESLLTHVWYPSTVATLSRSTLMTIGKALAKTSLNADGLPFMLHDFGFRGVSSFESAQIGGAAHLINARGTDTVPALQWAQRWYDADLDTLGFSVPATEHSVMTALGEDGEHDIISRLLDEYPTGILSIVGDSYNIYRFVRLICTDFKERILARDGKVVIRPDSVTPDHPTPEKEMVWIMDELYHGFGGHANAKGYRVLDEHVGVLWGDGIDPDGIDRILHEVIDNSYSVESLVFGMGGGLLQKVNRDTMRFAFKASAMKRDGTWHDVHKTPLDKSKASLKGRLALRSDGTNWVTVREEDNPVPVADVLRTVYENGELVEFTTFDEIRERAGTLVVAEPLGV